MSLINRVFIGIASGLLLFSHVYAADGPKPVPFIRTQPTPLPPISYLNAKGEKETLDASRTRLTFLHFWATWCVPCIKELPEVDTFAREMKSQNIAVIAIAMDGANIQRIKDFYGKHAITTLTANHDENMSAYRAVKGKHMPFTLVINAKGEEIARASGVVAWKSREVADIIDGK